MNLKFEKLLTAGFAAALAASFVTATPADAFLSKSKREIRANYIAGRSFKTEVNVKTWRELGIEGDLFRHWMADRDTIFKYCEFYKN